MGINEVTVCHLLNPHILLLLVYYQRHYHLMFTEHLLCASHMSKSPKMLCHLILTTSWSRQVYLPILQMRYLKHRLHKDTILIEPRSPDSLSGRQMPRPCCLNLHDLTASHTVWISISGLTGTNQQHSCFLTSVLDSVNLNIFLRNYKFSGGRWEK